jgi:hypothetical protein
MPLTWLIGCHWNIESMPLASALIEGVTERLCKSMFQLAVA